MFAEKIPVDRIDLAKTDPQYRTFCKAFAERLADSIKADGLAHPVVLRPNPGAPDRYLLVCGRHRLYAVTKILKQKTIDAVVRDDLDEAAAERLTLAENIWQCPPKKPQHVRAIYRWHQSYMARFNGN